VNCEGIVLMTGNSILRTEPARQSLLDVWLISVASGCANQHPGSDCQEEEEKEEGRWCGFCNPGAQHTDVYLRGRQATYIRTLIEAVRIDHDLSRLPWWCT
jgi:hypothetical protein